MASERFPAHLLPIGGAFRGTSLGFRKESTPQVLPRMSIIEYPLVAN